ncbi:xanthine dehydrogenase-like [Anthonomus grandis grandis]|uniref:xanthine dehydrogenase-like n=1 Tax=Anthonomus grandis grandis TaxID=2921223 RepID=UPI0021658C6E|nr:xanthine dehydrogenase-like [Anthonomus grandis grandis]
MGKRTDECVTMKNGNISNVLVFFVNGKKIEDSNVNPEWTLLYYLRNKLKLCGTKLGCGEGGCGACTVMVSKYERKQCKEIHIPVNACLAPVCSMHGLAVTTVEGIGSTKTKLHPVQERIAKAHGSQCGFCTPGFVMSMYTLLRQNPKPKMEDLEEAFQGNLCRCTGYRPIIEGYKTFTENWALTQNGTCAMGDKCCKLSGNWNQNSHEEVASLYKVPNGVSNELGSDRANNAFEVDERLFKSEEFTPYHASQEPIFPPELKLNDSYDLQYLKIEGPKVTWHRPTSLKKLLELKQEYPEAKIVVGNSEVGVETKFKNMYYPVIVHPSHVDELSEIVETEKGLKVGASATINNIDAYLKHQIQKHPEYKTRIFRGLIEMFHWFAGKQIRSVGAIGGNIMTGSPISDIIPILLASHVQLEVSSHSQKGTKLIPFDENFFKGYRKSCLDPSEVLLAIHLPFTTKNQFVKVYKQAKRKEDDIAIVNLALNVILDDNIIKNIRFGVGGMSFKTVCAPQTEIKLRGLEWCRETLNLGLESLASEFQLEAGAPGGMVRYRQSLVLSLFFRAFLAISSEVSGFKLNRQERDAALELNCRKEYKSSQYFQIHPSTDKVIDTLQQPIVHLSAYKQATGEAIYVDDMPHFEDELYLGLVFSTRSRAKIVSIDFTKALCIKGVFGTLTADDLPKNRNRIGTYIKDEKVFYSSEVSSQGQIVAALVAIDQATAQEAAKLVKIEYEDLTPVIITIEDAIKNQSFFPDEFNLKLEKGDVDKVFSEAENVIEGECYIGGQKHFYLETHSFIAVPLKEDNELDIYASSQHPTEVQKTVAEILEVSQNKINVKVKRLGGGFGGKEWKATMTSLPVALAAKKFNRPVRLMLDRNEDMVMHGGRNPFFIRYKVAFEDSGKILAVDYVIYVNAGYSIDFSYFVLERSLTHLENAFNIQTIRGKGFLCKTNIQSNTAMRGFGAPQIGYATTCIVDDIANYLGKDLAEISEINLYKEGDVTYYGQKLENCTLVDCWKQCMKMANYQERRRKVAEFNRKNRYKKRGLAIIPNKHGIGIPQVFMNQGAALVNVYSDGSVLLHHGGVEMGQGLYTKMIQIATRILEIPAERIFTSYTNTGIVPNTFETAASLGSDWNGGAVLNACQKIINRLKPFKEANPSGTWEEWVNAAHMSRVSLQATGFYATPDIDYDWVKKEGNMYNYFTYGVGCSEVEIDTLTGDHQVIRTDIVMDIGESLNPAIDIGQIEGAYMQGYGLYTMEEELFTPSGSIITRGPGNYKIPALSNVPGEFNVAILKGVSNPRAVYSSKAVGEPPLFLSCSVVFAIKDAIKSARKDNGVSEIFRLDSPATPERIRLACHDKILEKIPEEKDVDPRVSWSITI